MKKLLLAILVMLFASGSVFAQHPVFLRTSGHSGTGSNIDVKHHRFVWNIDPTASKRISGSVTTYFVTTQSGVNKITFDFNKASFNNASLNVKYHGTTCSTSFPTSGNLDVMTITLPVTLGNNVLDSVTIFYNGVPPAVNGQAEGCQQKSIAGYPLFYTLSESYEDKDWWPCKADMQDKIDSLTFIITTPSAYRPAANGLLVSEVTSGSNKIYTFKHKYPIASYLVAVACTQYNVYNRGTVNIGGTNMPVEYYISKGRSPTSAQLNAMDFCKQELVIFSDLFGDYPFKNEKYGMYEFGWGGGMEHQTFSAMGWSSFNSATVVAHELMHQWFGDKVTMGTWNHLWLAEGFASYGEVLAAEKIPAMGINPVTLRGSLKSAANGATESTYGCIIPNSSITNSNTLWSSVYGSSVYDRGGMVVSMLRTLLGDTKFFQACRNYLSDPVLAYASATTDDLRAHMEAECGGFDLTGFFNSFAQGNGYPTYSGSNAIQWQAVGTDKIRFGIVGQGKSSGSNVSYYNAVIPLRVQGAGGKDTLIVLYDQGSVGVSVGGNGITFGNSPTPEVYLGFTPTTVTFDPYNMSLATGTTLKSTVMAAGISNFNVKTVNSNNVASLTIADFGNVSSVILEHSTDGSHFTTSGPMKNNGTGSFTLSDLTFGTTTFYRAKVTLQSGQTLYSDIVKVAGDLTSQIKILSNPAKDLLRVTMPGNDKAVNYSILDVSGKTLLNGEKPINGNLLEINITSLRVGTYLLHIQSGTINKTVQFLTK